MFVNICRGDEIPLQQRETTLSKLIQGNQDEEGNLQGSEVFFKYIW